jgi:hypothetical protein
MATLNLSIEHGQTWDNARASFERGITQAAEQYGRWIQRVDWSDDRTAARLTGNGFVVDLRIDDRQLHVAGEIPFYFRLFEAPLRRFVEETFHRPKLGR